MIHFRITLNINHGITHTVKGFIHPLRNAALWACKQKGIKVNHFYSLLILKSYFCLPSFLPLCLILRDKFKVSHELFSL